MKVPFGGQLVNLSRNRTAVKQLRDEFGVSERRVVGESRSAQRYEEEPLSDNAGHTKRALELPKERSRFGYRRIALVPAVGQLPGEGYAGLSPLASGRIESASAEKGKRRRLASGKNGCHLRMAMHKNHVWCWGFVSGHTADESNLKSEVAVDRRRVHMTMLDTARGPARRERRCNRLVFGVFCDGGAQKCIRSDNGPEFIAQAIHRWQRRVEMETLFIEPGSPWEDRFVETFHSRFQADFLEIYESAGRRLTASRRRDYDHHPPHNSLGYDPAAEFAAGCTASTPRRLRLRLSLLLSSSSTAEIIQPALRRNRYWCFRYRSNTAATIR